MVLVNTGEHVGYLIKNTVEQDVSVYTVLSERTRESFDYIDLPFGQYSQDFIECVGYQVNTETKTLEFSYPDPNEPEVEQPFVTPLSEQVAVLKARQDATDAAVLQLLLEGTM